MPDRESYNVIWKKIIDPEIHHYEMVFPDHVQRIPFCQDAIWNKYVELNSYCKTHYMENPDERIDRHKVVACYMLAIALVSPVCLDPSTYSESDKHFIANELLAITVGFSILRAFVLSAIDESDNEECTKRVLKGKIVSGIKMPSDPYVHHGRYELNFANEIYYSVRDGNVNILSIAHELFLLELFTLYIDEHPTSGRKAF